MQKGEVRPRGPVLMGTLDMIFRQLRPRGPGLRSVGYLAVLARVSGGG